MPELSVEEHRAVLFLNWFRVLKTLRENLCRRIKSYFPEQEILEIAYVMTLLIEVSC